MGPVENVALIAGIAVAVVVLAVVALYLLRKRSSSGELLTRRRLRHARMTSEDLAKDLVGNVQVDTPATTAVLDVLISDPELLPPDFHERVDATVSADEAPLPRIDEAVIDRLKAKLDDMPAYLERISSGRFVTAAPGEDADVAVWETYLSTGMVYKEEALRAAVADLVDDLPVLTAADIEIDDEQEAEKQQRMIAEGVLVDPAVPGVLPEDVSAAARGLAQVQKRRRSSKPKGLAAVNVPLPSFRRQSGAGKAKKDGNDTKVGKDKATTQGWDISGSEPKGIDWRELGLPEDIPHAFIAQR